jgi:D-arabinose 1-dehydrogenase-like Zn-dependent alcohol dehydrogenase
VTASGAPIVRRTLLPAELRSPGATAGFLPRVNLRRVFALQLEILGTSMGTSEELGALLALCAQRGIRPVIDSEFGFSEIGDAFAKLHKGEVFGKIVIDHSR